MKSITRIVSAAALAAVLASGCTSGTSTSAASSDPTTNTSATVTQTSAHQPTAAQRQEVEKAAGRFVEAWFAYGYTDSEPRSYLDRSRDVATAEFIQEQRYGGGEEPGSPSYWETRRDPEATAQTSDVWQDLVSNRLRAGAEATSVELTWFDDEGERPVAYVDIDMSLFVTPAGEHRVYGLPWAAPEKASTRAGMVLMDGVWQVSSLWAVANGHRAAGQPSR